MYSASVKVSSVGFLRSPDTSSILGNVSSDPYGVSVSTLYRDGLPTSIEGHHPADKNTLPEVVFYVVL